jgi:hypothetical protein
MFFGQLDQFFLIQVIAVLVILYLYQKHCSGFVNYDTSISNLAPLQQT